MGRKSKFTKEQKIKSILDYKNDVNGFTQIKNDLGIRSSCFERWIALYDVTIYHVYLNYLKLF